MRTLSIVAIVAAAALALAQAHTLTLGGAATFADEQLTEKEASAIRLRGDDDDAYSGTFGGAGITGSPV